MLQNTKPFPCSFGCVLELFDFAKKIHTQPSITSWQRQPNAGLKYSNNRCTELNFNIAYLHLLALTQYFFQVLVFGSLKMLALPVPPTSQNHSAGDWVT